MRALAIYRADLQLRLVRLVLTDPAERLEWRMPEPPSATIGLSRTQRVRALEPLLDTLERDPPDVLVTTNDRPALEGIVLRRARRHGIPSVLLQDGLVADRSELGARQRAVRLAQRLAAPRAGWIGAPHPGAGRSDFVGLMGDHWRGRLHSRSRADGTERVVGQPLLDGAARLRATAPAPALGAPGAIVTYLATDFLTGLRDPAAHTRQLGDIAGARHALDAAGLAGITLVARAHPEEGAGPFATVAGPTTLVDAGESDLEAALAPSALVLASTSSALLGAIAAGRPALRFAPRALAGGRLGVRPVIPCAEALDTEALRAWLGELADPAGAERLATANLERIAAHASFEEGRTASERCARLVADAAALGVPDRR